MRRFRSKLIRNGAAALLLESTKVQKRMSNLIRVLKSEQHAIRPRYDRTRMLDEPLYLRSAGRKALEMKECRQGSPRWLPIRWSYISPIWK